MARNASADLYLSVCLSLSMLHIVLILRGDDDDRTTELNTRNGQTMQTILDKQENIIFIGDDLIICFTQREQLNAMISTAPLSFSSTSSFPTQLIWIRDWIANQLLRNRKTAYNEKLNTRKSHLISEREKSLAKCEINRRPSNLSFSIINE